MAKKQTAAKGKSKKGAPQLGLLSDWLLSLLKNVKPDMTKLDRAMMRDGVTKLFKSFEPTVTMPGNVDDTIIDFAASAFADMIDHATQAATDNGDGGGIVLGLPKGGAEAVEIEASDYTKQDAMDYLDALGTSVPDAQRKKILAHPEVLASLKRLSKVNQIKVINSSTLLDWLVRYGPTILSIIMTLLPFIA